MVTKISGQGEEKTYTVGQMFYVQPGATHEVSRNASQTEPAKLVAMIFAKKGSVLTTPVTDRRRTPPRLDIETRAGAQTRDPVVPHRRRCTLRDRACID